MSSETFNFYVRCMGKAAELLKAFRHNYIRGFFDAWNTCLQRCGYTPWNYYEQDNI